MEHEVYHSYEVAKQCIFGKNFKPVRLPEEIDGIKHYKDAHMI